MTRYFFDLHDCGTILADADGQDAVDLAAARDLAVSAARDVMCGEISEGKLCLSCYIEIRSNETDVVDRVPFRDAIHIIGL